MYSISMYVSSYQYLHFSVQIVIFTSMEIASETKRLIIPLQAGET